MENGIFVIVVLTCTDTLNEPNSKLDLKNINTFLDHSQVEENHGGKNNNMASVLVGKGEGERRLLCFIGSDQHVGPFTTMELAPSHTTSFRFL